MKDPYLDPPPCFIIWFDQLSDTCIYIYTLYYSTYKLRVQRYLSHSEAKLTFVCFDCSLAIPYGIRILKWLCVSMWSNTSLFVYCWLIYHDGIKNIFIEKYSNYIIVIQYSVIMTCYNSYWYEWRRNLILEVSSLAANLRMHWLIDQILHTQVR